MTNVQILELDHLDSKRVPPLKSLHDLGEAVQTLQAQGQHVRGEGNSLSFWGYNG